MKSAHHAILFLALVTELVQPTSTRACTDFQVRSQTGVILAARSMEWGSDLKSRVVVHPRNEKVTSRGPEGGTGLEWTSRFGYIGMDVAGLDAIVDGMNERGLSFGCLWLPGYTTYPPVPDSARSTAIDVTDLGRWILGTCESVDEACKAIKNASVCANPLAAFGGMPTAHVALHDSRGGCAVVEWIDGQTRIHENKNGVLTNAPPFEWQVVNLRNYIGIRSGDLKAVDAPSGVLEPLGRGSGFFGMPGDWTPPSRFVRTSAMLKFAQRPSTAQEAVNLAQHVLNAVDIPRGDIIEHTGDGKVFSDYTQWVAIKDLSNKVIYFRGYHNLNLKFIDLNHVNLAAGAPIVRVPVEIGDNGHDVTGLVK